MDTQAFDNLHEQLAEKLLPSIREIIIQELSSRLPAPLEGKNNESDFFKALTQELMGKISCIYQEIHSLQTTTDAIDNSSSNEQVKEAAGMVTDASERLTQIIEQTENATFDILDRVDRSLDNLGQIKYLCFNSDTPPQEKETLKTLLSTLNDDLLGITTGMSFQDLTGQRIKRVIEMLQRVEKMTADLYVSTGILLKARERNPDKNLKQTKQAVQQTVSQEDVDAMLEQLNEAPPKAG